MVADIEKAFLQVGLRLEDRNATRFLWLKDPTNPTIDGNLQSYRFGRLPFGVNASPHLLGATIKFHLDQYEDNLLAAQLQRNLYADNAIINVNSSTDPIKTYHDAKNMFNDAGKNLREWMTNDPQIREVIPQTNQAKDVVAKVLGIKWNSQPDVINLCTGNNSAEDPTKRQILSMTAECFDPMGLVNPITIQPRLVIQELWKADLKWDDAISDDIKNQWKRCKAELEQIPVIKMARQVDASTPTRSWLLAFTDASQKAYAACVYLWQETENGFNCQLVFSKARVSPLQPTITIPKLELTGVLIGMRALRFVKSQLDLNIEKMVLWTDPQIVLHWLNSNKVLPAYVTCRKKEIPKNSDAQFFYVPTKSNPADPATRGCTVTQLMQSTWFNGPE